MPLDGYFIFKNVLRDLYTVMLPIFWPSFHTPAVTPAATAAPNAVTLEDFKNYLSYYTLELTMTTQKFEGKVEETSFMAGLATSQPSRLACSCRRSGDPVIPEVFGENN